MRDATGAHAQVSFDTPASGRNAQRPSSPAVDMTDLEQMKARRKNRARGVLESVNAGSSGRNDTGTAYGTDVASERVELARPEAEENLAQALDAPMESSAEMTPATQSLLLRAEGMVHDSTRFASPSRQSPSLLRSPGRDVRRTGDSRSRRPSPRHQRSYSPGRRRDASRATSRASTAEFLDRLRAISSNGRVESDRAASRQRELSALAAGHSPKRDRGFSGRASVPQREPQLAPDLPARNHPRQTAPSGRENNGRDDSRMNEDASGSFGRAGRSPVERPGSRGRGAEQTPAAPARGAEAAWSPASTSTSSYSVQSQYVATTSARGGRASLSAMHTSAPAAGDLRTHRVSLLHAAREAQLRK